MFFIILIVAYDISVLEYIRVSITCAKLHAIKPEVINKTATNIRLVQLLFWLIASAAFFVCRLEKEVLLYGYI